MICTLHACCRDMNAATSQEVFAGPYLGDAATRVKFSQSFADMTNGFLAFPLCVPGTAVWKGYKGRLFILEVLAKGAAESKAKMKVRQCCESLTPGMARSILLMRIAP